jgi:hypothetical protein
MNWARRLIKGQADMHPAQVDWAILPQRCGVEDIYVE